MKDAALFEVPLIGSYYICDFKGDDYYESNGRYGVWLNGCRIAIQNNDLNIVKIAIAKDIVARLKRKQKELTQKFNQVNEAIEKSNNFEDWIEHYRVKD